MAKTFLQAGKAMHFAGSTVELQELTMKIGNNQTFGKTLYNRLQPSLVLAQQSFGAPALGNVVRQNYLGITPGKLQGMRSDFHIDQSTVLFSMPPDAGGVKVTWGIGN